MNPFRWMQIDSMRAALSLAALVLFAFCPLFAALYPLTQIYQHAEDSRRGDRTLVVSALHPA